MLFLEKYKALFITTISIILYGVFAYSLERSDFTTLCVLWFALFAIFYILLRQKNNTFCMLAVAAILFRLIFLFAIPNLSQDFYRFIWDGRMLLNGFNPYLYLPEAWIQQNLEPVAQAQALYDGMGVLNGSHYTNYPPLNQLCFFIAALLASKSILGATVVLRIIIILADIGILYFGKKILVHLNLPVKNIFWYFLNPFIIIEMTGNLHFEPVMLFFLVWAFYKLQKRKWVWAALLIACSIAVKLIPLLFLPIFFQWFMKNENHSEQSKAQKLKKLVCFYALIFGTLLLLFLPFYTHELIGNYTKSIGLWFGKFEFNGSLYYVLREIGYTFRGYNEIAIISKITALLTIVYLLYRSIFVNSIKGLELYTSLLFGISFYYFTAATVHPWYIATPLILGVFSTYKFPVFWSLLLFLTYQTYSQTTWKENLWFLGVEYLFLYSFFVYETYSKYKAQKKLKL
ncbi:hypothetical protein PI23P_01265 [Polaribacter irgensii 23-P]|uniref:Mannosyltransferase n=1 Tax=Polaribacter irgensii 23-P TaxID=313594 RepID=A4C2J0_9FLAO|nr:DUF2029 domain-containing protein [Polaribacter irgensii]EAR11791.1 hypothetical protein PI23P_01265 [Polaribacter irgensii 23-P]